MARVRESELGHGHVSVQVASGDCAEQFEEQYELHVGVSGCIRVGMVANARQIRTVGPLGFVADTGLAQQMSGKKKGRRSSQGLLQLHECILEALV